MFVNRNVRVILFIALFMLLLGGSVLADDGRINRAPYHFGGDTLFCNQETGCTLLDKTGHELANWPQNDIATAFAATDSTGQNTKVDGDKNGTYGPMQLWSVSPDATTGNNMLCMIGFDEWGKQNDMCFQVTQDYHYLQAPLPVHVTVSEDGTVVVVDHTCDVWSVGDTVRQTSDHSKRGEIISIDSKNGTATFGYSRPFSSYTAKCSEIEIYMP